jgi:hypothetical protein
LPSGKRWIIKVPGAQSESVLLVGWFKSPFSLWFLGC